MITAFDDAIDSARASWRSNVTVADKRWALRQLHGLYNLLLENRDEIIKDCHGVCSQPRILIEQEFALVIDDIAAHLSYVKAKDAVGTSQGTRFGNLSIYSQPCGVSLIISNSQYILRHAIAPLASSIAANNVVILASTKPSKAFSRLQREASKHLDTSTIHIVSDIIDAIQPEKFDRVLILDDERSRWSSALEHPNVFCYPVNQGLNVAVIDEGPLDVDKCRQEIVDHCTPSQLDIDSLHIIFVHERHFESLLRALVDGSAKNGSSHSSPGNLDIANCEHLAANFYSTDLASIGRAPDSVHGAVKGSGAILLLRSSSLDFIIDILSKVGPIRQASILAPASKKVQQYFEDWTRSTAVSGGRIPTLTIPMLPPFVLPSDDLPLASFPVSFFLQPRVHLSGKADPIVRSIAAIRKSYEEKIQQLEPEHSGGRVDFFVQVAYAVKTAAAVVIVAGLVGLGYGARTIKRRYM